MDGSTLQGLSYISMASNNSPLPRTILGPAPCVSIWRNSPISESECSPHHILQPSENPALNHDQVESGSVRSMSQEQPTSTEDPADAWFNAAGILLSLKHAAAERSARMGNQVDVLQWAPSENDHSVAQSQTTHLPVYGFSSPNDAAAFLVNALPNRSDSDTPRVFYSDIIHQEETVSSQSHHSSKGSSKPNKCRLCDKVYARPSTLRTHMRTHSGEKPYRCHICLKSFSQDANLTAHLRIHSGEKPFKCLVCDRRFAQSSSVTTHMRTHTGERPYRCKICSRGFADSSTLTKHLRTHTGEKPYKCKICHLKFSQSGNLNRHMRVHENGL